MAGLFYPDGSFKSKEQINYEHLDDPILIQNTDLNGKPRLEDWFEEFERRRDIQERFEGFKDDVEIEIQTAKPIILSFFGDQHIGGREVDYELLKHDTEFLSVFPGAYAVAGGDIIDGYFFNPAQDKSLGTFNEEHEFIKSLLDKIGGHKIVAGIAGDHDMWSSKMGITVYHDFVERYHSPLLRGSSIIRLKVGKQVYNIVVAHQLPGFSMYNKTHSKMRESNFGTQGADIYASFHEHKKAFAMQSARNIQGGLRQLYVSAGAYKYADDYSRKKGWGKQHPEERGAVWVVLYPFEKRMSAYWSAEEAVDSIIHKGV